MHVIFFRPVLFPVRDHFFYDSAVIMGSETTLCATRLSIQPASVTRLRFGTLIIWTLVSHVMRVMRSARKQVCTHFGPIKPSYWLEHDQCYRRSPSYTKYAKP